MVASNKGSREQRQSEKADMLFYIYYQIGPDRSLLKLTEICTAIGRKVAENTLKNYSVKFEWQKRLLDLTNKAAETREAEVLRTVTEMNNRHALIGQAMTAIAGHELRLFSEKRKDSKEPLGVYEITQLFKSGQFGERLARGEATSRSEVMVEVVALFVREFAAIFLGINSIQDEAERKAAYIQACNLMLRKVYPAAQDGDLKLVERA